MNYQQFEKFLIAVRQKVTKNQPTAYINQNDYKNSKGHKMYRKFWYSGKNTIRILEKGRIKK